MLSLRNRFGIPGVISVIALVFAMLGGAYAASNNGGGKATASAKAKRGPRGPKGATGPAGAQGPAGANGKDGAAGKDGSAGIQGSQGLPGKSVAVNNYSGPECAGSEEGATVEVAGEPATKKYVCDGEEGSPGSPGSPWTAGGTLPGGATETGVWVVAKSGADGAGGMLAPISFTIPLAAPLEGAEVHYINPAGKEVRIDEEEAELLEFTSTACLGTVDAPSATSGNLCIYAHKNTGLTYSDLIHKASSSGGSFEGGSAGVSGAIIPSVSGETFIGNGSWAVTG